MKTLSILWLLCAALSLGCDSGKPGHVLGGTVDGMSFAIAGQRSWRSGTDVFVEAANAAEDCGKLFTVQDGLLTVDLRLPKELQTTGVFDMTTNRIHIGVAAVTMKQGAPASRSWDLVSGTVWLDKLDGANVEGALAARNDAVSISGTFSTPLCATPYPK